MQKVKTCFCPHCRKDTEILWGKEIISQDIQGIQQDLLLTVAVCKECGQNVCPHGLINLNISEMEEQCKKKEILMEGENQMKNIDNEQNVVNQEILENIASLCNDEAKDHTDCQKCGEDYLFLMRDKEHEFSIGLRTILSCLAIAEKEEAVPRLPYAWWEAINGRY